MRDSAAWDARMRAAYAEFLRVKQRVGDEKPICEDWEARHRAFHMALLSTCASPTLLRFCEQIHDRFHRYRRMALPTKSLMGALGDDHGDMMEAAIKRDKPRAMSLLRNHIESSNRLIQDNITFEGPPAIPRRASAALQ